MQIHPIAIDWTAATENLYTTGSGRFDDGISIGAAPVARLLKIYKSTATLGVGLEIDNLGNADAIVGFALNSVAKFTLGIDNSVTGDPFKISVGSALGTNDALTIDSSGDFVIPGDISGGTFSGATISTGAGGLTIDDVTNSHSFGIEGDNGIDGIETDGFILWGGATQQRSLTVTGGDWTIDQDLQVAASPAFANLTLSTQLTAPLIETAATTDTLSIQPDATGTGVGLDLFKNAATGDRPIFRIYGYSNVYSSQHYADIFIDTYKRLQFSGTASSVLFNTDLTIDGWLRSPSTNNMAFGWSTAQTPQCALLGIQHWAAGGDSAALIICEESEIAYDFGHAIETNPTIFLHSGAANQDQWLSFQHDGTDGIIGVGTGFIKLNDQVLFTDKAVFTQTDGNEYIDSLNDGYMDYGATTGHRFNAPVGIGTTAPDSIFHIKANVAGTVGSHPAGQLIIQDPDDTVFGNAVITGYESDGAGNPDQQLWYLGSSSSGNSNIIFLNRRNSKLQLGTNDVSRLTILGNGNVGIGETSPQDKLEVNGTILVKDKLKFTQDDGNEYIDSLADGYMDYGATTAHRFNIDGANNDVRLEFIGTDLSGAVFWDESVGIWEWDNSMQIVKNSGTAPFFKINTTLAGAGDEVFFETNYDSGGTPIRARLESSQHLAQVGTFTLHDLDIVTNSVNRMTVSAAGYVRIKNKLMVGADSAPSLVLEVNADSIRIINTQSPASNGVGTQGEIAWDGDYIYVCTATNTWERAALTGEY